MRRRRLPRLVRSRAALPPLLALGLTVQPAAAPLSPAQSGRWYYEIGGAEAITAPANTYVNSITLGGSLDLRRSFSCGNFNPVLGVAHILNNVRSGAESMMAAMVNAAHAAVASLPALILQRANPGLYDLFQNALLRAEAMISLSTKSCQQMEAEIARGQNPFDGWAISAKALDWKMQMGTGGVNSAPVDVRTAETTVEDNAGKHGVPWLGGIRAGGLGQAPVRVTADTVQAGYNIELGRAVTDTGPAPGTAHIAQIWPTPDDAIAYAQYVLGDITVHTDRESPRASTPGHGLAPKIEQDRAQLAQEFARLLDGTKTPDAGTLATLSAPGTLLTREVIDGLRRLPTPQEQGVAAGKLAEEAAVARNLEKALLLRRLLLSGRLEPHIYASPAQPDLERLLSALEKEIDGVLYETRVRRELFAQTSGVLLDLGRSREDSGHATFPPGAKDAKPIERGGAVRP